MMIDSRTSARRFCVAVVLSLLVAALPGMAQTEAKFVCRGKVLDAENKPIVGYRIVYRTVGTADVALSAPTDENGEYSLLLPSGSLCAPVAVLAPNGRRYELGDRTPVEQQGDVARRDLQLDVIIPDSRMPSPAHGSDRLFLGFAEEPTMVHQRRYETQLEIDGYDTADVLVSNLIAAFQIAGLPDVEVGGRVGYAGVDNSVLADQAGLTDLELWAKVQVGSARGETTHFAVGGIVAFPTGDEDLGLGFGGFRSKVFGSMRIKGPRTRFTAHVGVQFSEDVDVGSTTLDGQTAAAGGVGLAVSMTRRSALILEALYEGKRFAGGQPDSRALFGVNWQFSRAAGARLAYAAGLEDGAPDSQVLIGVSFDF